jgi:hypothetical protein
MAAVIVIALLEAAGDRSRRQRPGGPATLKAIREAVSDRAEVFVARVRGRLRGAPPKPQEMIGMQYLVSVIFETADLATPDEQAAIDVFNDRLQADGHWVFAGGLAAPSSATVIDNRGGEVMVTDGPFLESKEYLAGFWIMEAADLDVALKLAAEGSKACNRKVEVRPFL